MPNPRQIQSSNYSAARELLIRAGSDTARASSIPHGGTRGTVPCDWGIQMLKDASEDLRGPPISRSGVQAPLSDADQATLSRAARTMRLEVW